MSQTVRQWQESYEDGFYGILTNPEEVRGCLSVTHGGQGITWWPLGKGQDEGVFINLAKQLHNYYTGAVNQTAAYVGWLGRRLAGMAKPKGQEDEE